MQVYYAGDTVEYVGELNSEIEKCINCKDWGFKMKYRFFIQSGKNRVEHIARHYSFKNYGYQCTSANFNDGLNKIKNMVKRLNKIKNIEIKVKKVKASEIEQGEILSIAHLVRCPETMERFGVFVQKLDWM